MKFQKTPVTNNDALSRMPPSVPRRILPDKNVNEETDVERNLIPTPESNTGQSCGEQWCYIGIWHFHGDPKEPGIKFVKQLPCLDNCITILIRFRVRAMMNPSGQSSVFLINYFIFKLSMCIHEK